MAEDNEVNQLLAVRMLERRGYRVGLDARALDASLERWAPTTDDSASLPALDRSAFERLRDDLGASDLLARLLDIFRTQTPEHLEVLRLAVSNGDAAKAAAIAHTLKGGAQTLAAARMAAPCRTREEEGRRGPWTLRPPW